MKKLLFRMTSTLLVLLLLFLTWGCSAKKTYTTSDFDEASKNDLTIYLDKKENVTIQRGDEILFQEPILHIQQITAVKDAFIVSTPTVFYKEDCALAIEYLCNSPLIFSKTDVDYEKSVLCDDIEFRDSEKELVFKLYHLSDGTLVFMDENGVCYGTDEGVFDYASFCKYQTSYGEFGG